MLVWAKPCIIDTLWQKNEQAHDILGYNMAKICFEGDIEELTETEITQPAILMVSFSGLFEGDRY